MRCHSTCVATLGQDGNSTPAESSDENAPKVKVSAFRQPGGPREPEGQSGKIEHRTVYSESDIREL